MLVEAPFIYSSWDLTQPISSPRSHLYHLKPIGIGTSEVESLTGYVARLADAHCVSPGDLIANQCGSLVKQPEGKSYLHQVSGSSEILNGTGQMASEFAQTFNQLTLRQDLHYLTLLQWSTVLPTKGLLRRFRAWCPICYEEWQECKETIYEPLLWALSVVSICPKHYTHLLSQCPRCQRQLPSLAWHSRPGYCSKCQHWLGSDTESCKTKIGSDEFEWQIWTTQNTGELLAYIPSLVASPERGHAARAISICIDHLTEGNAAQFCHKFGFLKSAVSQWRSGKVLPQLSVLLKICRILNVPLINFLLNPESISQTDILIISNPEPQKRPQQLKQQLETLTLQECLKAALEEEPPPTANMVAQRLGCSARSLRRRFPELCSSISARYLNHRDSLRKAKIEECCQEVRQTAVMLYSQGIEPTRSQVAQHLTKPAYFREPMVIAALHIVRIELGLD